MIFTAGLVLVTIVLWSTGKLPEYLTSLIFFSAAMIFHVAPATTVFSGFSSSAFWLILSGFVLGIAIRKTGLAERCANILVQRTTGSYLILISGIVLLTYALAFVMPSNMGRIALLMPVVMAMADRVGFQRGSPGRIGLALAVGFGTFQLSASILTANLPNLVMSGAVETIYGIRLSYFPYLLLHAPVLGILKGVALILCIRWMFNDRPISGEALPTPRVFSAAEKRLVVLLAITIALWLTDAWHGITPAWIGLASACFCLLPKWGFVKGEEFSKEINHRTLFYIAAILGLAAVVSSSGLGQMVGEALLKVVSLEPGATFRSFMSAIGITTALSFLVTANGVPALFTPLAYSFAEAAQLPLLSVLMIQVIGFSTPLLPYQASPIVMAMQLGNIPFRAAVRLSLAMAAITFIILAPLNYLWFVWTGWLP